LETLKKKVIYAGFGKLRWIKNKLAREWIQLARRVLYLESWILWFVSSRCQCLDLHKF